MSISITIERTLYTWKRKQRIRYILIKTKKNSSIVLNICDEECMHILLLSVLSQDSL